VERSGHRVAWQTDRMQHLEDTAEMTDESSPKITQVERLNGGVVISFGNGQEGFYSDESLHALLPDAQQRLEQALERDRKVETAD